MNAYAKPDTLAHAMHCAFTSWFGLERATANLLVSLYQHEGRPITAKCLAVLVSSSPKAIVYHVGRLRQALNTEAIDCHYGRGYCLTDDGMAECRAVLWNMGEELRRAS